MRRSLVRNIALLLATAAQALSCDSPQDRACADMRAEHIEKAKAEWDRDYSNFDTETFYSRTLDSCVHVEVARIGVEIEVRDLSHSIVRDRTYLLYCDADGADSVLLDAVRSHHGLVYDVPYQEWLDDSFGGPPRTIKTPDRPYTRADCQRVLDKWLSILAR